MKQNFIDFIKENVDFNLASKDVQDYWNAFQESKTKEKPAFTENGKLILNYMREHVSDIPMAKSKVIAEGLCISPRGVSGAMRKLVTDGYINKVGENPIIYQLTEKGKTFKFED